MAKTTNRRGGPYPYLHVTEFRLIDEGLAVHQVIARGASFAQAGAALGFSKTTAWRRYWWIVDRSLPERWGAKPGPIPPMRGTRACPRGRPWQPTLDGPGGPFGWRS